jgi:hypothetical protein
MSFGDTFAHQISEPSVEWCSQLRRSYGRCVVFLLAENQGRKFLLGFPHCSLMYAEVMQEFKVCVGCNGMMFVPV